MESGHVARQSTEPSPVTVTLKDATTVDHNPEQDSTQYTESTVTPVFSGE
jgi:hypothetical protein